MPKAIKIGSELKVIKKITLGKKTFPAGKIFIVKDIITVMGDDYITVQAPSGSIDSFYSEVIFELFELVE